ncbi:pectin lyase fold/virulence factor [Pyronema omphalodes]|nr:pectin lyase fold/virulence factor [Pyronema omphalodes]
MHTKDLVTDNLHIHLHLSNAEPPKPSQDGPTLVLASPLPSIDTPGPFELSINNTTIPTISNIEYSYAYFSPSPGAFTVKISHPSSALQSCRITPLKLSITPEITNGVITATFPTTGYYILKIDSYPELLLVSESREDHIPPPSGFRIHNVVSAGASNNNTDISSTTSAFQDCIDAANAGGGGTVFVPAGLYALGNLVLKSNVSLYLSAGSTLRFDPSYAYKIHWYKNSQGKRPITWWISTEFGSKNIKIFGRGVVDGNGVASAQSNIGNNLLVPISTTDFSCSGILFRNSASWAVTPIMVEGAVFRDVKFLNRFRDSGENDGIDVMHSSNVLIHNSIGVGLDDPFSTKTWSASLSDIAVPWPIPKGGLPGNDGVTFEQTVSWTICFGLKVGAGVWAPQQNITFRKAVVYDCSIAIGIHFQAGDSWVRGVSFEDVDVENVTWTNMNMRTWCAFFVTGGTDPTDGVQAAIMNVSVQDVTVRDMGQTTAQLVGRNDENGKLRGVSFDNVTLPDGKKAENLDEMGFTGGVRFAEDIKVV